MDPLPLFSICGTADLASKKADLTLISKILSQASSGHLVKLLELSAQEVNQ